MATEMITPTDTPRTDSGYSQPAPNCPLCQNNTMVWETTDGWKCNRAGCHTMIMTTKCIERITDYLMSGGSWNPELAIHDNVRDLLFDCRNELAASRAVVKRMKESVKHWEDQCLHFQHAWESSQATLNKLRYNSTKDQNAQEDDK